MLRKLEKYKWYSKKKNRWKNGSRFKTEAIKRKIYIKRQWQDIVLNNTITFWGVEPAEKYRNMKTFDELIEIEHGKIGTQSRNKYEEGAQMFIVSEMLKAARKEAKLTQEQLAEKAGTKKSYISKLENGKGNIQLSTLIRIFEQGLNRKIGLTFL